MQTKTVTIPAISCGHCKKTIESEVGELPGVTGVRVDLAGKRATIEWQPPAEWSAISTLLDEIGYPAAAAT